MSSKREEERNEKIIRGLMKLPPNRRCINCNSLGPQYVCTNFWTFVCMTCSGIHREFTHRVKSVSMAKFTSQEVDELQKGGNQRAREIYLKAWDPQRQRVPDNSNADKVRQFIKHVYVDKKYATDLSSDRPPRDPKNLRSQEDETRRASSYHSYSQSPPYDFQYEERRYGKQATGLTRKPGSDRGLYVGKLSSFLSPSRSSNHMYEDGFANEGSNPRASDYSVSSGGDPFRSEVLSPSSQKGIGSPFSETSRDMSREVSWNHASASNAGGNGEGSRGRMFPPQRTASSGSIGSLDSNSMSLKSVNSFGFFDATHEAEKPADVSHGKLSSFSSQPQASMSGNSDTLDLFGAPFAPQNDASALPSTNKSQLPDLIRQPSSSSIPTFSSEQHSQNTQPISLDLFAEMSQQKQPATSHGKTSEVAVPEDVGWATFDMPQNAAPTGTGGNLPGKFDLFSLVQSPAQESSHQGPSFSMPTLWHEDLQNVEAVINPTNPQFWNAFEDSALPQLNSNEQVVIQHPLHADKSIDLAIDDDGIVGKPDDSRTTQSNLMPPINMPSFDFPTVPPMAGVIPHSDVKPTNPFDLPFESEADSNSMFWDMSSLQAALPDNQAATSFGGSAAHPWFPQNPVSPYVPGAPTFDPSSGSLEFMAVQAPNTQIQNVPAQGHVASIGGNPFA